MFYGAGWLVVFLIAILALYEFSPKQYLDTDRSYFTCFSTGKSYLTKGLTEYTYYTLEDTKLTVEQNKQANQACAKTLDLNVPLNKMNDNDPPLYSLHFVPMTQGDWGEAIVWALGILAVGYVILEAIRQTALYILTGKEPEWLKNLRR